MTHRGAEKLNVLLEVQQRDGDSSGALARKGHSAGIATPCPDVPLDPSKCSLDISETEIPRAILRNLLAIPESKRFTNPLEGRLTASRGSRDDSS